MINIYNQLVSQVNQIAENRGDFSLPHINDCEINETEFSAGGATLYGRKYDITNGEDKIVVTYVSKDQCRTFQVNPDLNIVNITLYKNDVIIDKFSKEWDDRY